MIEVDALEKVPLQESTPVLDECGALRSSSATVLFSRRQFVGVAALGAAGFAMPGFAAIVSRNRWEVAREIVAAGAVGEMCVASAIVPVATDASTRKQFGRALPKPIADTLDGVLHALENNCPFGTNVAEHDTVSAISLTCTLDGGVRVAIASASPDVPFTATLRGTRGTLYMSDNSITVESGGQWRSVQS